MCKGFCAGGARVTFWPQKSAFGPQNTKNSDFCNNLVKRVACLRKSIGILLFLKYFLGNTWCFDMSKIMEFLKISWFSWKFHFSWNGRKNVITFFRKFMFSHPRGRLPRMLFKPMKYYTFWGVLGATGPLFEEKCVFIEILQKCRKSENHEISNFWL